MKAVASILEGFTDLVPHSDCLLDYLLQSSHTLTPEEFEDADRNPAQTFQSALEDGHHAQTDPTWPCLIWKNTLLCVCPSG